MRQRHAVMFAVYAFLFTAALSAAAQKKVWTPLRAGDTAAAFTVQTLDGASVSSADLRGKVVLLTFWGTY